jgi:3-oxoacyl-[acyl-carrier protein] reductase
MDLGFKGRVALVTGAGSQIGYGKDISLFLAREGCDIAVADIDLKGARQTAKEIKALGHKAISVKADVTNQAEVEKMVQIVLNKFSKIDILVNNAGASSGVKPFLAMTPEECDFNVKVNLYGQMNVTRAVLPHMIARHYGRIVHISGGQGIANISVYGAAKAGIEAFTHAVAGEVAPQGVIINGVYPGLARTGLTVDVPREFVDVNIQMSALKRLCTAQDVSPVVAFLASDMCSYMVGQFIHMDTFC